MFAAYRYNNRYIIEYYIIKCNMSNDENVVSKGIRINGNSYRTVLKNLIIR